MFISNLGKELLCHFVHFGVFCISLLPVFLFSTVV